jgi:hypothetical protein
MRGDLVNILLLQECRAPLASLVAFQAGIQYKTPSRFIR